MDTLIKVDEIKSYMYYNKLTKQQFCKKCNISIGVLNKILNGKNNIRISVLFKIADVLNIEVYRFFDKQ